MALKQYPVPEPYQPRRNGLETDLPTFCIKEPTEGNEDTKYKRTIAKYLEKVGHKVSWQKLGADFQDETFRFHVLDEGEYEDRDWRDDRKRFLEDSSAYDAK